MRTPGGDELRALSGPEHASCLQGPNSAGELTMPKLALIATLEVATGKRDQVLPLLNAHTARCLKDEPGTLQFQVLVPREDATKLFIYELYRDDAAFEAHRDGP